MALSDGRVVTVGADKTVRVWHANGNGTSTILPTVHTDVVRGVIPGQRVASSPSQTILRWLFGKLEENLYLSPSV